MGEIAKWQFFPFGPLASEPHCTSTATMSLIAPDSLKAIAESVGIADLSDDVAKLLAPDAEYRLREIAQVSVHLRLSFETFEDQPQ